MKNYIFKYDYQIYNSLIHIVSSKILFSLYFIFIRNLHFIFSPKSKIWNKSQQNVAEKSNIAKYWV